MAKPRSSKKNSGKPSPNACSLPPVEPRDLPLGLHPERMHLIRVSEKKWVNGTTIRYHFFDRPTDGPNGGWVGGEAQKSVVRKAFQHWKELGIGLVFEEVADREDAEVRIGFLQGDGSWSYVGRDVVDKAPDPNERTMNFGWDLTTDYGWDTALHEIGHTLGFPHEHQNPNAGIVWDEPAVYRYFRGHPNFWNDAKTNWNVLRKLSSAEVGGSPWDPNSIMHYEFEPGLIKEPPEYGGGLMPEAGLSEKDIEWVRTFYPPLEPERDSELRPFESNRLLMAAGQQVNYRIRPRFTRTYTIQTFGDSDTVVVLFETIDGHNWYVDGDDDSGFDRNARLRLRLYRGRDYVLRVRLYHSHLAGEAAIMMW